MKAILRPRALGMLATLTALTICLLCPDDALAQWNRRAEAVSVTEDPAAAGVYDVHAIFEIHTDGSSTVPDDIATDVDLLVNGTLVATNTVPVGSDPGAGNCVDAAGCGNGCGSGAVDGIPNNLLCLADGPCNPICDCKCKFPPITSTFPGMSLAPGDEIMVLLRPAPGAVPDTDPADDIVQFLFDEPVFWDRTITAVTLVESPAAPGFYDVTVDGTAFHEGIQHFLPAGAAADLGIEMEVQVNGVVHSVGTIPFEPVPIAAQCTCAASCATWDGNTHSCVAYLNTNDCVCGWPWRSVVPSVPVAPGDEIMVLLRPVPGALPELPGFPDDEHRETCCRTTGVETIAAGAGTAALEQNRPNPFRSSTSIAFSADAGVKVALDVLDVRGRRVRSLWSATASERAGLHTVSWDGRTDAGAPVPAGVYFYRLAVDGKTETRKMTLTK